MSVQRPALRSLRRIRSVIARPSTRTIATHSLSSNTCSHTNSSPLLSRAEVLPTKLFPASSYSTTSRQSSNSPAPPQTSAEMAEPTGLIAKSGIELLTLGTPNGYKASIILEELKEAYGKEYTWQAINIGKNTQKEPWFTAVGANGRIPVIVDHDRDGFPVFEGLAILGYLTRRYDPENRFSFPVDSNEYDEAETWLAWQHGGIGPMQGQGNHFLRFAKESIPYGIQRYIGETERLYGILNSRLADREWVVGNKFSIVDINLLGWANATALGGIDLEEQFPNVAKWLERALARPGVQKGFSVPAVSSFSNAAVKKAIATDPEAKKRHEETVKLINDAKEKYGYKYSSP
ncbi:glutathione S-transferase [Xylaria arbuscula]|nr:glutathione S-transferase [Xylaria arbuscula]